MIIQSKIFLFFVESVENYRRKGRKARGIPAEFRLNSTGMKRNEMRLWQSNESDQTDWNRFQDLAWFEIERNKAPL